MESTPEKCIDLICSPKEFCFHQHEVTDVLSSPLHLTPSHSQLQSVLKTILFTRTKRGRISLYCTDFLLLDAYIPKYMETHRFWKITVMSSDIKMKRTWGKSTKGTGTLRSNSEGAEGPSADDAWESAQVGKVCITTHTPGSRLCSLFPYCLSPGQAFINIWGKNVEEYELVCIMALRVFWSVINVWGDGH